MSERVLELLRLIAEITDLNLGQIVREAITHDRDLSGWSNEQIHALIGVRCSTFGPGWEKRLESLLHYKEFGSPPC